MKQALSLILTVVSFLLFLGGYAQQYVTNSPDSVCAGSQDVVYRIPPPAGVSPLSYNWGITGAGVMTVMAAPVNDSIWVDWPNTAGVDTVKVFPSNGTGCVGPVASLPVVRYLTSATLSGNAATLCTGTAPGDPYTITFTGSPPFSVTYQFSSGADVIGPVTVNNINTTTYTFTLPAVPNAGTYTGSIVSAHDKRCSISNLGGSPVLTVINQAAPPVILHLD